MNAIQRAVDVAGGQKSLAKKAGVSYQAVQKWVRNRRVPAERVIDVEKVTGISRHLLNPEIYPRESAA